MIRGIVEGDSVPELFLPRLVALWEQGRFPIDRMTFYDFDQINEAAHDAETGVVVKPVLRITAPTGGPRSLSGSAASPRA